MNTTLLSPAYCMKKSLQMLLECLSPQAFLLELPNAPKSLYSGHEMSRMNSLIGAFYTPRTLLLLFTFLQTIQYDISPNQKFLFHFPLSMTLCHHLPLVGEETCQDEKGAFSFVFRKFADRNAVVI